MTKLVVIPIYSSLRKLLVAIDFEINNQFHLGWLGDIIAFAYEAVFNPDLEDTAYNEKLLHLSKLGWNMSNHAGRGLEIDVLTQLLFDTISNMQDTIITQDFPSIEHKPEVISMDKESLKVLLRS